MPDLHRTNINLNAEDVAYFQQKYGYGWTEKIREIVHAWVLDQQITYKVINLTHEEWRKVNSIKVTEPGDWDGTDE